MYNTYLLTQNKQKEIIQNITYSETFIKQNKYQIICQSILSLVLLFLLKLFNNNLF